MSLKWLMKRISTAPKREMGCFPSRESFFHLNNFGTICAGLRSIKSDPPFLGFTYQRLHLIV